MKQKGFPPIIGKNSQVLILGSFPGKESLQKKQYYAYRSNTFWYILGKLLNVDPNDGYEEKKESLIKNKIALWDVLRSCEREGSLDSSIKNQTIKINDFNNLFEKYSSIKCIFFNGSKAEYEYEKRVLPMLNKKNQNIEYHILPSTSPAMAMLAKEQKLKVWSVIIKKY